MRSASGAHRGLSLWLMQRLSALWLACSLPLFVVYSTSQATLDYETWRSLFVPLPVRIGGFLFILALVVHAWIGLREILIDYVHALWLRLPLYFTFAILYLGCLVWTVDLLWGTT